MRQKTFLLKLRPVIGQAVVGEETHLQLTTGGDTQDMLVTVRPGECPRILILAHLWRLELE